MEHRWGERHEVSLAVRLLDKQGRSVRATTVNVSASGALVSTAQELTPLSNVIVELQMPAGFTPAKLVLGAYVIRTFRGGAGIEWCEPFPIEAVSLVKNAPLRGQSLAIQFVGLSA